MNLASEEKNEVRKRRCKLVASHLDEAAHHIQAQNWHEFYKSMERAKAALLIAEEAK